MAHQKLSFENCDIFLTKHLHLSNWKHILETDPLAFLKQFVEAHVTHIYYHNIHILSQSEEGRHVPTEEEIIESSLRGQGGVCLELNHFAKVLLQSVGLKAWSVFGHCISVPQITNNHYVVIVELGGGARYMIDVGQAHPVTSPVLLSVGGKNEILYQDTMLGFPFEYIKCAGLEDGSAGHILERGEHFARVHHKGRCSIGEFNNGIQTEKFMRFNLEPHEISEYVEGMRPLFTGKDEKKVFISSLGMSRFLPRSKDGGRKFVMIIGMQMITGGEEERTVTLFENLDQAKSAVLEYFPNLDQIEKAIENLKKYLLVYSSRS